MSGLGAHHPHYRAVAAPFCILYAAWPLAAANLVVVAVVLTVLTLLGSTSIAAISMMPLTIAGHVAAIALTNRYKFALQQIMALGNVKRGSTNLGVEGSQTFDNS